MLKTLQLLLTFNFSLLTCFAVFSQGGVGINTGGAVAHQSAILDVSSDNAGMLIPRMTKMQRNAITSPAEGLFIYQTNDTVGFWYHSGGVWKLMGSGAGSAMPTGTNTGNTLYWDGSQWIESSNIYNAGGSVGINTNIPDLSAAIDVSSTTKGALIPRMTTAQRNAIQNPAGGLQIINSTTNCLEIFFPPVWQSIYCGCTLPSAPTAGTHTPSQTEIEWNWGTVSVATGYKYNTTNDYSTATDNGTNTSYTQIGLICNTPYTLYVWSYSACGNSSATTLNQTTTSCFTCGSSSVTFTYNTSPVTYGTVSGNYNGGQYCWLDRNLGAITFATNINHTDGYGDIFQWGRLDDGHQLRSSNNSTTTLSTTDNPGHNSFIKAPNSPNDWRSGQNNNLWQGVSGTNNPCPTGWRLPTETELNNERISWAGGNNYSGAIQSTLKLPAAGARVCSTGVLFDVDNYGYYWSSTVSGTYARYLKFFNTDAFMDGTLRGYGFSVRCIRD